jgi:hypothetical protein
VIKEGENSLIRSHLTRTQIASQVQAKEKKKNTTKIRANWWKIKFRDKIQDIVSLFFSSFVFPLTGRVNA